MRCLWFPDTVLQYWSGNYWDNFKAPSSFSGSHFSLFLPILIEQISAFPRKEKRVRTVQERAWRRRDQPALQAKITWLMIFTSRNVGFFPFQFRIVLTVLPSFKERLLAISLSASLKLSFWGSSPREILPLYQNLAVSINQPPFDVVWFISFVSLQT